MKAKIRKAAGAAIVTIGIFFLFGCSSSNEAAPVVTVTAEPDSAYSSEGEFLAEVRSETPTIGLAPESQILDTGYSVCDAFAAGATPQDFINQFIVQNPDASTADAGDFGTFIGLSVKHLCPQYISVIEESLASDYV